jgi:hypothetical protein
MTHAYRLPSPLSLRLIEIRVPDESPAGHGGDQCLLLTVFIASPSESGWQLLNRIRDPRLYRGRPA